MTLKLYRTAALCLLCLLIWAAPAYAVDEYGKVYPQEIAPALTNPVTASAESKALLQSITLPASLGITIPHIDTGKIHDTMPLNGPNPDLRELGYTEAQMLNMDYGDYRNIMNQQPLNEQQIKLYASEKLPAEKLRQMTYGEYLKAYSQILDEANLPTPEQQAQFAARNITLPDANRLCKDFQQYENVLAQDDALLKEYLESYYQFDVDFVLGRAQMPLKTTVDTTPKASAVCPVYTSDGGRLPRARC